MLIHVAVIVTAISIASGFVYQRYKPVTCHCQIHGDGDTGLRLSFEAPRASCGSFGGAVWIKTQPELMRRITMCSESK